MDTKLLTVRQAAKLLGVSPDTLRRWDKAGKLTATRHPMNNYRVYSNQLIDKLKNQILKNAEK